MQRSEAGFPTVAGFELVEVVGQGGFATVYRAHQSALDRTVALKVIRSAGHADPDRVRRFERECQSIGSLTGHPSVMTVFGVGETDQGDPYLALEYLAHGSIERRFGVRQPVPTAEAVRIGIAVAEALAAAHSLEIIHRDVKPANVLADRFGNYKLGDFGIAGFRSATTTTLGTTATTVAYAAPEVLMGARATVSSDLYGLGATLYSVLVGHPAHASPDDVNVGSMIYRITSVELPPLPSWCGPPELRHLVERLMAKDPARRPTSAKNVAAELRSIEATLNSEQTRQRLPESLDVPTVSPLSARVPPPAPGLDDVTRPVLDVGSQVAGLDVGSQVVSEPALGPGTPRRRRGPFVALGVVVLILLVAIGMALVSGRDADGAAAMIPTDQEPRWLALGEGSLWVSNHRSGTVTRVDTGTSEVTATIKVGDSSGPLVAAFGSVWVSNYDEGTVARIDPRSNTISATIDAGTTPDWVVVGHGSVWVANFNSGSVTRIDPATDRVVATIDVGQSPRWLAEGEDGMWLSTYDFVVHIDTDTNKVADRVAVGGDPGSLVADGGDVWVVAGRRVVRIDQATATVADRVELDEDGGWLAVVEDRPWVALAKSVVPIDPGSGDLGDPVRIGVAPQWRGVHGSDLWVTNASKDEVVQVDAEAGVVTERFKVDGAPSFVVVDDRSAWVAAEDADEVHQFER